MEKILKVGQVWKLNKTNSCYAKIYSFPAPDMVWYLLGSRPHSFDLVSRASDTTAGFKRRYEVLISDPNPISKIPLASRWRKL